MLIEVNSKSELDLPKPWIAPKLVVLDCSRIVAGGTEFAKESTSADNNLLLS